METLYAVIGVEVYLPSQGTHIYFFLEEDLPKLEVKNGCQIIAVVPIANFNMGDGLELLTKEKAP